MTGETEQHAGTSAGRRRLCVIAGDPSGDIAGFHFLRAMRARFPQVEVFGLGGERMRSLGQRQLARGSDLAALGFWEVARRWRFFSRLLRETANEITRLRPAAVVLLDYPGFNLRLAERIAGLKIPIIYYIAPQVWAWGT
ncbi:MAG TPA: lipid-A-disaccharide synthase, partial [candidate division Zixibacteria bacterium]|nr:lipid-A-disaccharide synthase [candidate division Zixibacteria bacterium]